MPGFGQPVTTDQVATIRATLDAGGMVVSSLDIVPITPDFDPDRQRGADTLRAFAARARAHGLPIGVEFVSFSPLRSLADAVALIDEVDDPGVGITFDILHFVRTGGVLAELDATTVAKIGYVQICDGPETMAPDQLMWQAGSQRYDPTDQADRSRTDSACAALAAI